MIDRIERITKVFPELSAIQVKSIDLIVEQFKRKYISIVSNPSSDLLPNNFLNDFGDMIRLHHCFSKGPFSKDKFEFALEDAFNANGRKAELAPSGTPSVDIYIEGQSYSLKTQANKSLQLNKIHISKFREIGSFGKSNWTDQISDIQFLTQDFVAKLDRCDRILVLRNISPKRKSKSKKSLSDLDLKSSLVKVYKYELVEIPIDLLKKAQTGNFSLANSNSIPRSGYCKVYQETELMFQLYFDGAGEQKLQVQKLQKKFCIVHATWEFDVKPVLPDSEDAQTEE